MVTSGAVFRRNKINCGDTRTDNFSPSYYASLDTKGLYFDFKACAYIDRPFNTDWCALITVAPWFNTSVGFPVQIAIPLDGTNVMKFRTGTSASTWGAWSNAK